MNQETWKVYKETYSRRYGKRTYEVSNLGNVKVNGELIDFTKYIEQNKGYLGIGHFYIHRAVAELFVPNPENKPEVDHINRNRYDNRAENLRWCTHKQNTDNRINGMLGNNHKQETKNLISIVQTGTRFVNNGIERHRVSGKKLEYYLSNGFQYGYKLN